MSIASRSTADMTPEERRALLAQLLQDKARAARTTAPLSHSQAALWFTHSMAPDSAAYNVAFTAAVRSMVDVAAMGRAFQGLVDRHSALRTTFQAPNGKPQQVIAGAADLDFVQVDAAGWSEAEMHAQVTAAYKLPFDLEHGPLLRVFLFTRGAADHVLLVALHHIVFDGSSMGILLDEFQALYRAECGGAAANLAPIQHSYTDFVHWQNTLLAGPEGHKLRDYWHNKLAGTLPLIDLPLDRPRPAVQTFHGAEHELRLSRPLVQQLRALARAEHTTLYSVLLAAFYVLVHRYSGQDDLIIGTPMMGRSRAEFQRMIGYFVSPVALRVDLAGQPTFRAVLSQVRQTVLDALEHQDYPLTKLVEALQPRRSPGRSAIIEVLFNIQQVQRLGSMADRMVAHEGPISQESGQLDLELFNVSQEDGQFDLTLLMFEAGDDVFGGLKYNPDLFDAATIARMGGHYVQLLERIVADPATQIDLLPMLSADERRHTLVELNATARPYDLTATLHQLIEAQVARQPAAPALWFDGETMSYADLNARANQLAQRLMTLGVGPDVLVGVCAERSFELVIALLATLKAGGAYVPLDPGYPAERLQFMLQDAAPKVVLTQSTLVRRLSLPGDVADAPAVIQPAVIQPTVIQLDRDEDALAALPSTNPTRDVTANNLAYMIYTSGSTGQPKGAMNEHRGIVNRLLWMQEQYGLNAGDKVMQKTPFSFDVSVWEFFWPLLTGATLVLAQPDGHKDPAYLVDLIQSEGITTLHFVPSMLKLFLDDEGVAGCTSLRRVICSGEALPHDLVERVFAVLPDVELHNLYGPTEAAVDVTYWQCRAGDPRGIVPIGKPVANTQIYVLDRHLKPVPQGVAGELHIGGVQVGRGYHHRDALTAERFIVDPFNTAIDGPITLESSAPRRLYKTGDLARYLADGSLEYLGRIDFQVKIRGFRIELGEIETALVRHASVREAVVTAHTDRRGDKRLVAYLTVGDGAPPGAGELRSFLRQSLPDYMVPSMFLFLERMPLNANGKIDRRALPTPDPVRARGDSGHVAPSTATEQAIAAVWQDILAVDRVSVYDNFFDLGGHSLIAVEALARLNQQLGVKLGPADIRLQTLGQLAATYDNLLAQPKAEPAPAPAEDSASRAGGLFGAVRRIVVRKPARAG